MKVVDKVKVAHCFRRGRTTYDSHARIQRRVSSRLIEKLGGYPAMSFSRVLEIGCCTGMLSEMLVDTYPVETLYLNDLVGEFFDDVVNRLQGRRCRLEPLFGDIETLPLPTGLDLVISSATFQWLADLKRLFASIADALNDSGSLAFSIFGPGTLGEFRKVTGIGLEYTAVGKIGDLLEEHFLIEDMETVKDQLFFATPREVLRHLQATGVGGVQDFRWSPGSLRSFERRYLDLYGSAAGVPVTYFSSSIIARKKRGTGT